MYSLLLAIFATDCKYLYVCYLLLVLTFVSRLLLQLVNNVSKQGSLNMEKFEENLFRGRKGLVCFSFGFRLRLLFAFVLFLTALAKSALNNYESDVSFKKKKRFIKEK